MKIQFQWILVAALMVCGAIFTACTKDIGGEEPDNGANYIINNV